MVKRLAVEVKWHNVTIFLAHPFNI